MKGATHMLACLLFVAPAAVYGSECDQDELDLCDSPATTPAGGDEAATSKASSTDRLSLFTLLLPSAFGKFRVPASFLFLAIAPSLVEAGPAAAPKAGPKGSTCGRLKEVYKASACCGKPDKTLEYQALPVPSTTIISGKNPCAGVKESKTQPAFKNKPCLDAAKKVAADIEEQSATNVTLGYNGTMATVGSNGVSYDPITDEYWQKGLCPVNVHWHLGAEHLSVGEFDENGKGPTIPYGRRLGPGSPVEHGRRCHHYDPTDKKFTTPYQWQHCVNMTVGETYEVHWPHSTQGMCGTVWQYQSPFYDGVFCNFNGEGVNKPIKSTHEDIGVHGQVFVIVNDVVNDGKYYFPEMMRGMIKGHGDYGKDVTYYTGSTTGTSRSNEVCSAYAPITWQVDRKCHLISASSFDKMCADMKNQAADMTADLQPAGSRELVATKLAANNFMFAKPAR